MTTIQAGRLALREEGSWWVAYFAHPDTMERAQHLGQIRMALVQDPTVKEAFMLLMRHAVTVMLTDISEGDAEITWPNDPVRAPEHERKKN